MKKTILSLLFLSACSIHNNRDGYDDAWYYERLYPYYTNDLSFAPRVHLRAVAELVGAPFVFEDGTVGHVDYLRHDIEFFFAAPVDDETQRDELILSAIKITCPETALDGVLDKIAFSSDEYVVLQGVACKGHAS